MKIDTAVAGATWAPSRGFLTGKYAKRIAVPCALVVHTTGIGPIARFERERTEKLWRTPLDSAIWIYRRIMDSGPHYLIGQRGEVVQMCPEDLCAWGVGSRGSWRYDPKAWARLKGRKEVAWWSRRWPDLPHGPAQLGGGRIWLGRSVNANAIHVEVVPPLEDPRGPWSGAAWAALAEIAADVAARHGWDPAKGRIVSHSDTHPFDRTRAGIPWDPGPQQWLWATMERALLAR